MERNAAMLHTTKECGQKRMSTHNIRHRSRMACVFSAFLLFTSILSGQTSAPPNKTPTVPGTATAQERGGASLLRQLNNAMEVMVAKTSPAVVQIVVTGYGPIQSQGEDDVSVLAPEKSLGSGVIVDPEGYIVTNAHVVHGAQRIRVILPQRPSNSSFQLRDFSAGKVLEAKVVGVDTAADLAVVKVEASGLPSLPLTSSRAATQGQMVFAIGSPKGLENSVTMGVVSLPLRQPDPDNPRVFIQTDTPINPG